MKKKNNMKMIAKVIFAVAGSIYIIISLVGLVQKFTSNGVNDSELEDDGIVVGENVDSNINSTEIKMKKNNNEGELLIDLSKNPFVDISLLKKALTETPDMNLANGLPKIPNSQSVPPASIGSIPIPQIPQGNAPNIKPAEMPNYHSDNNEAVAVHPAEVKGILIGEQGESYAIMGDGKVVTEGDYFNDGRIAYIGGDGIQFDNGNVLSFK